MRNPCIFNNLLTFPISVGSMRAFDGYSDKDDRAVIMPWSQLSDNNYLYDDPDTIVPKLWVDDYSDFLTLARIKPANGETIDFDLEAIDHKPQDNTSITIDSKSATAFFSFIGDGSDTAFLPGFDVYILNPRKERNSGLMKQISSDGNLMQNKVRAYELLLLMFTRTKVVAGVCFTTSKNQLFLPKYSNSEGFVNDHPEKTPEYHPQFFYSVPRPLHIAYNFNIYHNLFSINAKNDNYLLQMQLDLEHTYDYPGKAFGFDQAHYTGNAKEVELYAGEYLPLQGIRSLRIIRNAKIEPMYLVETALAIHNDLPVPINIFCVNSNNEEVLLNHLPAGQKYVESVHVDDLLIIREAKHGVYLKELYAQRGFMTIAVTPELLLQSDVLSIAEKIAVDKYLDYVDLYNKLNPYGFNTGTFPEGTIIVNSNHANVNDMLIVNTIKKESAYIKTYLTAERPNGVLYEGEVAFFTEPNYQGEVMIVNDQTPFLTEEVSKITGHDQDSKIWKLFPDSADPKIGSYKVGPNTTFALSGVKQLTYQVNDITNRYDYKINGEENLTNNIIKFEGKVKGNLPFDIDLPVHFTTSNPSLAEIEGRVNLSIKRTLSPEQEGLTILTNLSEDYRPGPGGEPEEFSAFRTTIKLAPAYFNAPNRAKRDLYIYSGIDRPMTIHVLNDKTHEMDAVTIKPPQMGRAPYYKYTFDENCRFVIRQDAIPLVDGNSKDDPNGIKHLAPSKLLVRTGDMLETEFLTIHPEIAFHQRMIDKFHEDKDPLADAKVGSGYLVKNEKIRTDPQARKSAQKAILNLAKSAVHGAHRSHHGTQSHVYYDGGRMEHDHWVFGQHPNDANKFGYFPVKENTPIHAALQAKEAGKTFATDKQYNVEWLDGSPASCKKVIEKIGEGFKYVVVKAVEGIEKAAKWVIDKAKKLIEVTIHFAENAVRFIVDTVEKMGHAIVSVFKAIETAIEDAVKWIRMALDFPLYWKMGKVITNSFDSMVMGNTAQDPGLRYQITKVKNGLDNKLNNFKKTIDQDLMNAFKNTGKAAAPTAPHKNEAIEVLEWFLDHLVKLVTKSPDTLISKIAQKAFNDAENLNNPFTNINDSINKYASAVSPYSNSFSTVSGALSHHAAPIDALQPIGQLIKDLFDLMFTTFETKVVDGIFNFVDQAIIHLDELSKIDILDIILSGLGFIGKLIKKLIDAILPDISKVDIKGLVGLLYGIPVTIAYKAKFGMGEQPFEEGTNLWTKELSGNNPQLSYTLDFLRGVGRLIAIPPTLINLAAASGKGGSIPEAGKQVGKFLVYSSMIGSTGAIIANLKLAHKEQSGIRHEVGEVRAWTGIVSSLLALLGTLSGPKAKFQLVSDPKVKIVLKSLAGVVVLGATVRLLVDHAQSDAGTASILLDSAVIAEALGNLCQILGIDGGDPALAAGGLVTTLYGTSAVLYFDAGTKTMTLK